MSDILIKIMADGLVAVVVLIGAATLLFCVPNKQKYQAYCRILMAGLTAYLVAKLIAAIYQPTGSRPFEILGVDPAASFLNNPGFPSDHVLFSMAIVLAVWFETRRKVIAVILLIFTLAVAVGRVLALVHSPLDVAGGLVIAFAGVPWYLQRESSHKNHENKEEKVTVGAEARQKHKIHVK